MEYGYFDLSERIASLPRGYVTQKKIKGHLYYYHQWVDDSGKGHYMSISEEEALTLRRAIEERKTLQKQLKRMNAAATFAEGSFLANYGCSTNVIRGEALLSMASTAEGMKKRDCYEETADFLYGPAGDCVCLLYGLRRTGKTTLLRQLILDMEPENLKKTVYIKLRSEDTLAALNHDMKMLQGQGYKYVFLDEVTLMPEFIDSASLFSDVYAPMGMKIILSGTDSLGFYFASNEELYDRCIMIHTSYIPYREHVRLLGACGIDRYIRYGGTWKAGELRFEDKIFSDEKASFRDDESTRRYVDTAICRNIQNALKYYDHGSHFRNLKKLYEADELTSAVNRILQDMNHSFTKDVILKHFVSRDLRSAAQMLRKEKKEEDRTDSLDMLDTTWVLDVFKRILNIREPEALTVTDVQAEEIERYLKILELIDYGQKETIENGGESESFVIFTQPGMRYCQAEALVYSLLRDASFKALSEREKLLISKKILEDVRGILLEDIIYLETKKFCFPTQHVYKLILEVGEIDMLIYDEEKDSCRLYEIKHSSVQNPNQLRHMKSSENRKAIEKKYGKIEACTVLYLGENKDLGDNCYYRNAEEYLLQL